MLVATHALGKQYGPVAALKECTLGVRAGEIFGLLGPNGAGKTTLLRLLLGFLQPTGGRAEIAGLDCWRQSLAVRQRVAYLPGEARLSRTMYGREVLALFARFRPDASFERSVALAARMELDLSRRVALMSTGMRQKLALCLTLACDTELVILDEPTANLDPTARGEVLALVREARAVGRTVIFSSHVLSEVEQTCDRVVFLRAGQVAREQTLAALRRQHRIRAELTGPLPAVPAALAGQLVVHQNGGQQVLIETPGELSPLLGWLATLPLAEVTIEPVGLQAVYEAVHGGEENDNR